MKKSFVDYFAGIGLVQLGLERGGWTHNLSLDYNKVKKYAYESNFDSNHHNRYLVQDIFTLQGHEVPYAFLAHASFPCTDVSAAGSKEGSQNGKESSAIDSFLRILGEMASKKPPMIMLENVKGLITSNKGMDLRFLIQRLNKAGYYIDLVSIDARNFVPQSRERIFIIGHHKSLCTLPILSVDEIEKLTLSSVRKNYVINFIKGNLDLNWVCHDLPQLPTLTTSLDEIIDKKESFWEQGRTDYLCSQMFTRHLEWVEQNVNNQHYTYATVFRRMRMRNGKNQSTAELRTDGIAGCLRTSKGGSAKQILIRVGKGQIKARLLSPKECATLMGASNYELPKDFSVSDSLYCFGDAVCVDVIVWLEENYLTPFYDIYTKLDITEVGHKEVEMNPISLLNPQLVSEVESKWRSWCQEHYDKNSELPIRGRVYGALIVLSNLEDSQWNFESLCEVKSTDRGDFFTDRSIKNHTTHRVSLVLSTHDKYHLKPSRGEQGRTSTGTKRAGLELIKHLSYLYKRGKIIGCKSDELTSGLTQLFFQYIFNVLEKYNDLGGIKVLFKASESISTFIQRVIHEHQTNSGAVIQHLIGAKLELRYMESKNVVVEHQKANVADLKTSRLGNFEIGNTIFHVTKSPNHEHRKNALINAMNGKKVYLLVPSNIAFSQREIAINEGLGEKFGTMVETFSIEQFISQNLDELALFDKTQAIIKLRTLLENYNSIVNKFENDKSIKIVIPDFGL